MKTAQILTFTYADIKPESCRKDERDMRISDLLPEARAKCGEIKVIQFHGAITTLLRCVLPDGLAGYHLVEVNPDYISSAEQYYWGNSSFLQELFLQDLT